MFKKFVSIFVAAMMCMASVAFAEPVPSKGAMDLNNFEVVPENLPEGMTADDLFIAPVTEQVMGENLHDYQARLDICQLEINKLAQFPNVEEYFGEITDAEGNVVTLAQILGIELKEGEVLPLNVFEFCPLIVGGYEEVFGKVTATMLFATPYEKDEKVAVMIGIVNQDEDAAPIAAPDAAAAAAPTQAPTAEVQLDADTDAAAKLLIDPTKEYTVKWQAFNGVGLEAIAEQEETYGRIQVEFTSECMDAIQNNMALMAVVSIDNLQAQASAEPTAEATEAPAAEQ